MIKRGLKSRKVLLVNDGPHKNSSIYWNMVHGNTPDQVKKDEEGMQTMRILGRNMAYYLKCIEEGRKNGIIPPKQERVNFTNFIR